REPGATRVDSRPLFEFHARRRDRHLPGCYLARLRADEGGEAGTGWVRAHRGYQDRVPVRHRCPWPEVGVPRERCQARRNVRVLVRVVEDREAELLDRREVAALPDQQPGGMEEPGADGRERHRHRVADPEIAARAGAADRADLRRRWRDLGATVLTREPD